jgi:hypothetical protein
MLRAVGQLYLKHGGRVARYSAIEEGDLCKLRDYFDRSGPLQLQEEVVFLLLYYFGMRGSEWMRQLVR